MRSETEVRDALAELVTVARRSALLPKNAEKGHWKNLGVRDLLVIFLEEAGEVARAYNHDESIESLIAEIGDAAWVLAMLLDNATGIKTTVELIQAAHTSRAPVPPIEEMFPVSEAQFKKTEQERLQKKPMVPPPALEVAFARYEEEPMPGCHLELKLLGAKDICGACGFAAEQHRNWKGRKG